MFYHLADAAVLKDRPTRTNFSASRLIIADLTDPSSIPQELQAIIPSVRVPVQPLLLKGLMFKDFDPQDFYWVPSDLLRYALKRIAPRRFALPRCARGEISRTFSRPTKSLARRALAGGVEAARSNCDGHHKMSEFRRRR